MAKIQWVFQDESGTNLNRYIATNVETGEQTTFDLLRGGSISVVGTPLNAEKLNELVSAINQAYDLIDTKEKDTTYTLSKINHSIILSSSDGINNNVALDKTDVGLENVDNTRDIDKPISTKTQEGLEQRVLKTTTINNKSLQSDIILRGEDIPYSADGTKSIKEKIDEFSKYTPLTEKNYQEFFNPLKSNDVVLDKKELFFQRTNVYGLVTITLNSNPIIRKISTTVAGRITIPIEVDYKITDPNNIYFKITAPDENTTGTTVIISIYDMFNNSVTKTVKVVQTGASI